MRPCCIQMIFPWLQDRLPFPSTSIIFTFFVFVACSVVLCCEGPAAAHECAQGAVKVELSGRTSPGYLPWRAFADCEELIRSDKDQPV